MTAAPDIADIIADKLPDVAALCRRFRVRRLELFGSAANGRFDPARSDLDFLVEFDENTRRNGFATYFGFREALEALFARKVDLLSGPIINPYLRRQIETERRPLFPL